MTGFKPRSKCPSCGRCPNVRFTEAEVARAKRERQAARVMSVACPRCSTQYWLHARDIANSTAEKPTRADEPAPPSKPARGKRRKKKGVDPTPRAAVG